MGKVIAVNFRARRHVRELRRCDRCADPAQLGGLCAWHLLVAEAETADLRARIAIEQAAGERCCDQRCRQPIPRRQVRAVLADGRAMHLRCAMAAPESEAAASGGGEAS